MTKAYEFNWQIPVPEPLLNGCNFDMWEEEKEETIYQQDALFKVDEMGFFIFWKSQGKDGRVLELSQVNDIRKGGLPKDPKFTDQLANRFKGKNLDDISLTVCSGLDYVNVNYTHIVCPDADTAKTWQDGLRKITNNIKANNVCPSTNLRKHWMRMKMVVDPNGKIPVRRIAKTFASGKSEKLVYQCFADLGLPSEKTDTIEPDDFTLDKFISIYFKVCPRNDIEELFQSITQGKTDTINMNKFVDWLNDCQRDPRLNEILYPKYTEKRAGEIIGTYEQNEENVKAGKISKEGFIKYLMSDENAPVFLDKLDFYMEMDQPLAHYYINSSHNTYLSGKQFGGKSCVEMYRQTLLAGCRCVELDCWDGQGKDEEPIITHGKAMCTDILFKDAIYAIRDCAFITSEYPVILSFENHCCKKQQYKLAKYSDEIFGDLLLKEPLPGHPLEPGKPLPAPNELKMKIMIKNKRLKPDVEKQELELFRKGQLAEEEGPKESADGAPVEKKEEGEGAPGAQPYTGGTTLVHPWLSSMINYAQPVKFAGFDVAAEKNIHHNMSSFAETAALGYLKSQAIEFVNYNKRQMSRIYPKGTRVDSSNYMPQIFWNSGSQLVALNFQTPDLPMQLNQGKFEYNGGCGYLLKPEFMRRDDKIFDPFSESPVDGVIAAECSVRVIAGQFLSDKKVGTYVEVDMYGLPADTIRKEFKTRMVPANGLNPVYNEEPFVFRKVVLPDLAVIRIGVYDESNKILAQRILPLDGLQAGYRHVSLRTEGNFPMSLAMLFICVELKIYVPDGLGDLMDALSDPRAFLSAQEKRVAQMKAMGIDETDVQTQGLVLQGDKKPGEKAAEKKDEFKMEPITRESLREEKAYKKILKKQQKEMGALMKKQAKEEATMMKNQCNAIEKYMKSNKDADVTTDNKLKDLVTNQAQEWSQLMERHKTEEWELLKAHSAQAAEIFEKAIVEVQARQLKTLQQKFDNETKDMKARQAKISVDTAKEVAGDQTLKTKADKDRRLKEKNQNNTKKFIEERKNQAIKQSKEKDKLIKAHEKQIADLKKENQNEVGILEFNIIEYKLADKKVCFV